MALDNKSKSGLAVFVTLSILYFFSIVHRVATASIADNLIIDFNTDNSVLGLMSGMYFYAYAAAQLPVGIILDKIGTRKTLTFLGLVASIGNLLFALSPTVPLLAAGRALIGFGVGGFYVSALKTLAVSYNPRRNATLTGVLTSIGNIGGIVASSPLALLALALGWRETFLIIFSVMFLFVAVAWFSIKDPENKPTPTSKRRIKEDLKKIFSTRPLLAVLPVPFFVYGCFVSFQGLWAGPYLMNVYGMNKADASLSFMFISIGFILALPLAGFISDKMGKKKPVLLTGLILTLLFWLIMTFFGGNLGNYQLIALLAFLGFAYGIACIFLTIPAALFPKEIAGSAIASLNIFNFIGGGVFQFLMGFIIDSTNQAGNAFIPYQSIFIMSAIGVLLALVCSLFFKEQKRIANKVG